MVAVDRKASAATSVHVYTGVGMPTVVAPAPVVAPSSVTHDETYWRGRIDPLRVKMQADAWNHLAAIQAAGFASRTRFTDTRFVAAVEVTRTKAVAAASRDALELVLEEARRGGALPGWLREK